MSITSTTPTKEHLDTAEPIDPWMFGKAIQQSQPKGLQYMHTLLFNKGRYFETSVYDMNVRQQLIALTGIQPQYETMFVAKWDKLEDFVIAMNICNYYVFIDIDYI